MTSFFRENITIKKAVILSVLFALFILLVNSWKYIKGTYDIEYLHYHYGILINSIVHLLGITLFFKHFKIRDALVFRKVKPKFYIISIILGVVYVFSQKWLNYLYDFIVGTDFAEMTLFDFSEIKYRVKANLFAIAFLAPIFEELFFRNYIQRGLDNFYNNPLISIGVSTLLFTLIHLPDIHLM